jgi:hypothetical protein
MALRERLTPTLPQETRTFVTTTFKVGDKVLIIRKAKSHERDWENSWVEEMDNSVGKIGIVKHISTGLKYNIDVEYDGETLGYPSFVLELAKPEPVVPGLGGFKAGDKVQVKAERNSKNFSLVSAIVNFVDEVYVHIETVTGLNGAFYPSNLEFIPEKPMYGVRPSIYKLAMSKAIELAKSGYGYVNADDVQASLKADGYLPEDLGNAAGALFRSKCFENVGTTRSLREGNRGRRIIVWKYIGA